MQILIKPIITEKADAMNDSSVYAFRVNEKANKIQVKKAVEEKYGVTVDSVRTLNIAGKFKSKFTKSGVISGRKPNYKKAYVKLAKDEFIDIYEGAE